MISPAFAKMSYEAMVRKSQGKPVSEDNYRVLWR